MMRKMMLSVVIGEVITSFIPIYMDLALSCLISKPVETHVSGLGAFTLHVGMHKIVGG